MVSFTATFNPPSVGVTKLFARVSIDGIYFDDYIEMNVTSAISDNNSAGSFNIKFDNYSGEHATSFNIGDEVIIYVDENINPPVTSFFIGIIEYIQFSDKPNSGSVTISGRDFSSLLQDATVQPIVYTSAEVSTIVTDIIADNVPEIITSGVDVTSKTLDRISFNHLNVFDALKQLAQLSRSIFWVNSSKVLQFKAKSMTSSGVQLDNTNVISSSFKLSDDGLYNEVWVYGDRVLTKWQNNFTANGGSVFTLDYKPHNTQVLVGGGSMPYRGGVLEMINVPQSGIQYLVSYNDKQIIFVSGTNPGDNVPASGTAVKVDYDRSTPIVKFAEDNASKTMYKKKVKIIQDKTIKDPNTAKEIAKNTVADNKDIKRMGDLDLFGVYNLVAGQTVVVDLPYNGVNNQVYDVIECKYTFNKSTLNSRQVLRVRVSKKLTDFVDTFKQLLLDVKKLQGQDFDSSDVITRLQSTTGSAGVRTTSWTVRSVGIGSDFYLGSPESVNGWLGHFEGTTPFAWWKLNESGASIVDAVSGWIGSPTNVSWISGLGSVGIALECSGTANVNFGNPSSIDFGIGSPFSVLTWLKCTSGSISTTNAQTIIVKGSTSACRFGFDCCGNGSAFTRIRWGGRSGTTPVTANAETPNYNEWFHLAGVYNPSTTTFQVYFNGSPGSSNTITGFNTLTGSLYLGRGGVISGNVGSSMALQFWDARIYNNTLNGSEIQTIYNGGAGTQVPTSGMGGSYWIGSHALNWMVIASGGD